MPAELWEITATGTATRLVTGSHAGLAAQQGECGMMTVPSTDSAVGFLAGFLMPAYGQVLWPAATLLLGVIRCPGTSDSYIIPLYI